MAFRDHARAVALAGLIAVATSAHAQGTTPSAESDSLLGFKPPPLLNAAGIVSSPPDFPRGRVIGLAYADYFYNAGGDPRHGYNAAGADTVAPVYIDGSGKPIGRDLNGLQIRRLYLQVDNDLSYRFSTRFRVEADSKSLGSDGKIGVFVKGAYLRWRSIVPRGDAAMGMIATPTFGDAEDFWQYRSVEKTITDFRGLASSADLGLSLTGFADEDHHAGYAVMIGDDSGQKPETNRQKRAYLALPLRWSDLRFEPYADYEVIAGGKDRALYKVFAGYERYKWAVGAEAFSQVQHAPSGPFKEPRGVSVFVRTTPLTTLAGFARVDYWVPDTRTAKRVDQVLWLAGLDYQPIRDVHVMPNFEAMRYRARGGAVVPTSQDLQLRLTLSYTFARPQS
jgi:hypothetical protein